MSLKQLGLAAFSAALAIAANPIQLPAVAAMTTAAAQASIAQLAQANTQSDRLFERRLDGCW